MGGGFRLDNRQRSSDMPPKRKCKFNDDWRRDFTWIAKLPDNAMAQCNLCMTDFSISSGGRTDVRRYQGSACHGESNEGIREHCCRPRLTVTFDRPCSCQTSKCFVRAAKRAALEYNIKHMRCC